MEKINFNGVELLKIDPTSTENIKKEFESKKNWELSNRYLISIYDIKDSKFLVDYDTHACIFKSLNDLVQFFREDTLLSTEAKKPEYYPDFIQKLNSNLAYVQNYMNIRLNTENLEDLKKIDSFINNNKDLINVDSLFTPLVATIGEFIKNNLDEAYWELITDEQTNTPYIHDKNKRCYNPHRIVIKELEEYLQEENEVSFYDHVIIELLQYKFINRN